MSKRAPSPGDFLRSLQTGKRLTRGAHCPDEERLRLLAAGLTDRAESSELLGHTATCDWCGARLREAVQDFAAPPARDAGPLPWRQPGGPRIPRSRLIWGVPAGVLASVLAVFSPALIQQYKLA